MACTGKERETGLRCRPGEVHIQRVTTRNQRYFAARSSESDGLLVCTVAPSMAARSALARGVRREHDGVHPPRSASMASDRLLRKPERRSAAPEMAGR